ncbi:MAG: cyclic nucleotide-binding domain-containing protein [Candidatus Dormibacteraeota bacterium]|nr:cyclic nucleotide-binding domain-containing protein [Candidatus Dormibacteraeota bacterium]MBV9524460.1 cyclic nucleotide-binding domain-containing protein [Candidatus Dormibacteraeota bacterium]
MTERIERSVTSISWIPSEAVEGMTKAAFTSGFSHYDDPPPDVIEDLEALRAADRFRFANQLTAWIDVDGDRIVDSGYTGGGMIGATTVRLGPKAITFAAVPLPDKQETPDVGGTWARFTQTAGGRTGLPAPRPVRYPPFVQISAPIAWTTLSLTIHADGRAEHAVAGASAFPRHWIYDDGGKLVAKTGLVDWSDWFGKAFGSRTPWGGEDSPALVTQVETALERELSTHIMRGERRPRIREVKAGAMLVEQGDVGTQLYLVLDGVLSVEVSGEPLAQVGPGAVLGERALLESGARTASLRAVTQCRVAEVEGDAIDPSFLHELAVGHRREHG